jgi:stage V sporulation protein B
MAEKNKRSGTSFLVQGSILAVASVVSRIIGLFYRIPFTNIVGDLGNNYYGTAFKIYNILLIISSYSLPLAVSKLVSSNIAQGRRRNVYRILKCALLFGAISGTLAALVLYFGAEFITGTLMSTPLSIFAVKTLVPVLLIVAILGVMRGFFQGLGTMMPSAVSQILEQIVNAIVSIWAAYVLYAYGAKAGAILGNAENYAAAYGAAGGTIGTGSGAAAALLFCTFVLIAYLGRFKRRMRKERKSNVDSYGSIFHLLLITIVPVLLSSTIYNCNSIIDEAVYKKIAFWQGYSDSIIGVQNGIFSGKYQTLINIPISIASALAASSVPALTAAYAEGNRKEAKRQIGLSTRFIMVIAFPCAVGMGVLASPILQLLFHDSSELAARMVQIGAASIVFFALSTLSNGLLQGMNRMNEPIKNAVIALVLHVIILVALMLVLDLNIYAVVLANAAFGLLMCLLNAHSIKKCSGYRQEIRKTFFVPAVSAAGMGLVVWGVYELLLYLLRINAVATLVSICVGAFVYAALLLRLKGLNEKEMLSFPKGRTLANIAKKMHLLP